jgi:hypothetical protein
VRTTRSSIKLDVSTRCSEKTKPRLATLFRGRARGLLSPDGDLRNLYQYTQRPRWPNIWTTRACAHMRAKGNRGDRDKQLPTGPILGPNSVGRGGTARD